MAILITTSGLFTDNSLPVLKIDSILPDAGALFLFDASKTADLSFINQQDGVIENLAYVQAASLIPGLLKTEAAGITSKVFGSSAAGSAKLTSKKGIHVINSQVSSANGNGFSIALPTKIKQYMLANATHAYFVSLWGKITRGTLDTTGQYTQYGILQNLNSTRLNWFTTTDVSPSGNSLGKRVSGSFATIGNFIRNAAHSTFTAPGLSDPASLNAYFQVGSKDVYGGSNVNKAASAILYKGYIEDLTVSGRSYATVNAIDYNLYLQDLGSGGRFDGDIYDDPATIA